VCDVQGLGKKRATINGRRIQRNVASPKSFVSDCGFQHAGSSVSIVP